MVDLESNYSKFIVNEPNNISNLVTDPFEEKMYFKSGVKVKKGNFDGSDIEVIHESENNSIKIFALDSVERRMYWMYTIDDFDRSQLDKMMIYVGDINFDEGQNILYAIPSNLALDPYSRLATLPVQIIPS